MGITGGEYRQLVQGLVNAFPTWSAMTAMVQYQLDQNLESITPNAGLNAVAFALVQWAVAQNRLEDLVRGARAENPGNPDLQLIEVEIERAVPPGKGDLSSLVPLLRWADANGRLGQLIALACGPGAPEPDLRAFVSETLASAADRVKIAAPTPTPTDAHPSTPDAAGVLRGLARGYDAIRKAMTFSDARTRALEEVASQMRAVSPGMLSLVDEFAAGATPGERLAAVMILQESPVAERLTWLAGCVRNEKPFVGYHAALALRNAARSDKVDRAAVRAAVQDALAILRDVYSTRYQEKERAQVLADALALVGGEASSASTGGGRVS